MWTFYVILLFVTVCQFGCVSEQTISQNSNIVSPISTPTYDIPDITVIDIKLEDFEAQKLLDSGIKFDDIMDADGVWIDGKLSSNHLYKSSDDVEISTSVNVYKKPKYAEKDFQNFLKDIAKIMKREPILDKNQNPIGEKIVGITTEHNFVVVRKEEKSCQIHSSYSLKHLLAFEKWREK